MEDSTVVDAKVKDAEYWKRVYDMKPFQKGYPYVSSFSDVGESTDKLPGNYPAGSTRSSASTVHVLLTNKEPPHSGINWTSGRPLTIHNHLRGDPVEFVTINPKDGKLTQAELGVDKEGGHTFIYTPGCFGAYRLKERTSENAFALLNVTHVPGYVIKEDHESHTADEMKKKFPQHCEVIEKFGSVE